MLLFLGNCLINTFTWIVVIIVAGCMVTTTGILFMGLFELLVYALQELT